MPDPLLRRPVCLPKPSPPAPAFTDYSGEVAVVAGWGCSSEAECGEREHLPVDVKVVAMPVINNDLAMCW